MWWCWGDLGEVTGSRCAVLMTGDSVLLKSAPGALSSAHRMRTQRRRHLGTRKWALTGPQICQRLELPACRTVGTRRVLLGPPVRGALLGARRGLGPQGALEGSGGSCGSWKLICLSMRLSEVGVGLTAGER